MKEYQNPLIERYASKEMSYLFSPQKKFSTWRKLWLSLAESQQALGLPITDEQINALKENIDNIDFELAKRYEKKFKHDVMAHVHTFGDAAPAARGIIHLGATSAFVGDNTDIIQAKEALTLLQSRLLSVLNLFKKIIEKNKSIPTLGFTHFQPAQLTTVGKRACLWAQSFLFDLNELEHIIRHLRLRGVKGTTGTGASFKDLFDGDFEKLKALDKKIAEAMGFEKSYAVGGQTYDRKVDSILLNLLSNIAQSAHKFSNDIRLLAGMKQIEEPFGKGQIGSSAMAYKRNPMKSERVGSLAKFVLSLASSPAFVASTQWFERTLDDSANKRLALPQAMLATDAILILTHSILDGLVVYPKVIEKAVLAELPFMITEHIIMEGVKKGGDRQALHETIRQCSIQAAEQVKMYGKENDLLERLAQAPDIPFNLAQLKALASPERFIGFSIEQCEEFISKELGPVLKKNQSMIAEKSHDINV